MDLFSAFQFMFSIVHSPPSPFSFFFFNDPPTTEIYTLPLHDALPISAGVGRLRQSTTPVPCAEEIVCENPETHVRTLCGGPWVARGDRRCPAELHRSVVAQRRGDRKSTRLNSSHT